MNGMITGSAALPVNERNIVLAHVYKDIEIKARRVRRRIYLIRCLIFILFVLSTANMMSTTLMVTSTSNIIVRHLIGFAVGGFGYWIISNISYRKLANKGLNFVMLVSSILILIAVPLGGKYFPSVFPKINGATSWVKLSFIQIQPSELLKIVFVLIVARLLTNGEDNRVRGLSIFGNILPCILLPIAIFKQNDLGTAFHYWLILFLMTIFTSLRARAIISLLGFFTVVAAIGGYITNIFNPNQYQIRRIVSWWNGLWTHMYDNDIGFQVKQSLAALGSGGLIGRGYGTSILKYNYLPEIRTDFIMSTLGEEHGFIGLCIVIMLFFMLFRALCNTAKGCDDRFGRYVAIGVTGYIMIQAFINLGMCTGLAPVIGIPMPFFSFGGSSTVGILVALGIVENINKTMYNKYDRQMINIHAEQQNTILSQNKSNKTNNTNNIMEEDE